MFTFFCFRTTSHSSNGCYWGVACISGPAARVCGAVEEMLFSRLDVAKAAFGAHKNDVFDRCATTN